MKIKRHTEPVQAVPLGSLARGDCFRFETTPSGMENCIYMVTKPATGDRAGYAPEVVHLSTGGVTSASIRSMVEPVNATLTWSPK